MRDADVLTASGRYGVSGPFGVPASSRNVFHAEARSGALLNATNTRTRGGTERGGKISPPDHERLLGRGWRGRLRWRRKIDPESRSPRGSAASACFA